MGCHGRQLGRMAVWRQTSLVRGSTLGVCSHGRSPLASGSCGERARRTPTQTWTGPRSRDVLRCARSSATGPDEGRTNARACGPAGLWEATDVSGIVVTVAVTTAALPRALIRVLGTVRGMGRFTLDSLLHHACAATENALGPTAGVAALSRSPGWRRSWLPWSLL